MGTRGRRRACRRVARVALAALAVLATGALAACGSKSFPNDPRPPTPIEVSAKVTSSNVVVSPSHFGAGLVDFTIANLSNSPVHFTVNGPGTSASSVEIAPSSPGNLKVQMKEGDYQASGGAGASAKPASIKVGPERPTSQNKLLQP